ncbi:hydantoinase/oxoprolinase N-terminal domain-containing protein, partial [Paracoccus yeei]|uniref:hydantoinase/oxoprolinase N-terminal domain-containing protein n=1 Tax=Paracoccus yeei TaxID=147645 RepID=UPI0037D5B001
MKSPYAPRLAVDIGGTFTDVVLETAPGEFLSGKYLTTHAAPEQAVMTGVSDLLQRSGTPAEAVGVMVHGTTLATNALIERKGAKIALITTRGFRDSLEIAFEHRFEVSDLYMVRPEPLVPRNLRLEVTERMAADGSVLLDLDDASVAALVPVLRENGIEAVAVCLLHSYANPAHEARVGAILRAAMPELRITLSARICPEMREYERGSTACANAYVQPVMEGSLRRLESSLRQ